MNIPNFMDIGVVIKEGDSYMWSDEWSNIIQQLIQTLQDNAGREGLVMPTLSAADILTVQNNLAQDGTTYTCQYGTMVYDSTNNRVMIAVSDGGLPPAPIFKTVTLT